MDFDDITYARNEAKKTAWQHHMASIGSGILKLASKYCNNQPCYAYGICGGAFNYCIRVAFDADEGVEAHWMMRFPIPGAVMYPEAKVGFTELLVPFQDLCGISQHAVGKLCSIDLPYSLALTRN